MAHTKQKGSSKLGRDSQSKRLGVKIYGEQLAKAGSIIIRQRGSNVLSGENTLMGKDDTIYSTIAGKVKFNDIHKRKFDGNIRKAKIVSVEPLDK
ncbi:MAG: 50S ribosomal protein L27 [Patescibacteria group bacterium]|jgi:large subunit ribosomal protein L27